MNLTFDDLKNNFFLIAGPCCIESEEHALRMATEIKKITDKLGIKYIFKSSFDKANRTSIHSYRGPGLEEGLRILKKVKDEVGVPILTDIHLPSQAPAIAKVADIIQIPAFLARQTDLLVATAKTGCIINVKKPQFASHVTMKHVCEKLIESGNTQILLTERGTFFGYGELVVDFRNLVQMRENKGALIVHDCGHSLQMPNRGSKTMGQRELIAPLARAAVAIGVDGLFLEVHDRPTEALSDSATQYPLDQLEKLLVELLSINRLVKKMI